MADEAKSDYEKFFNINISDFYEYVASVMGDFGFVFHKSLKELPNKRRIELWKFKTSDSDQAIIWIEITNSGSDVPREVPAEVLRVMNDENLTKLFFFTNGGLQESEKETLEAKEHYIFTPSEIIDLMSIIRDKEKKDVTVNRRKSVKVPSGFILIKNYLDSHKGNIKNIVIRIDDIPKYGEKISKKISNILDASSQVADINNIPQEDRDSLKKMQYSILPELTNISSLNLPPELANVKEIFFDGVKNCILYIGALVEYESEDLLEKYLDLTKKNMAAIGETKNKVENYKKEQIKKSYKISLRLFLVTIFVLFLGVLLYFNITR